MEERYGGVGMADALKAAIERRLSNLSESLTSNLRTTAIAARWPEEIASTLSVIFEDDKVEISYPEESAQEIEDLEYGSTSGIANPVMRLFTMSSKAAVDTAIVEAVNNYVASTEVFL